MNDLFKLYTYKCSPCSKSLVGELKRKCYACDNGLVGQINDTKKIDNTFYEGNLEEIWECRCQYYYCSCEDNENFFCPVCNDYFRCSDYLLEVFGENKKPLWIANMITHHRHNHITSWNKRWDGTYNGNTYIGEDKYEEEKAKINEQAKRQIVTKCKDFIVFHKITVDDLLLLQNNEAKTIEKWMKILSK